MNYEVRISLRLEEQKREVLRFHLRVENRSSIKLLFPYPRITDLQFLVPGTKIKPQWFTDTTCSGDWSGFALTPGESKQITFPVRPRSIRYSEQIDAAFDYERWCAGLTPGELHAWFEFRVDENYFCGTSHYRYRDLLREAEAEQAVVWEGETKSEIVQLVVF